MSAMRISSLTTSIWHQALKGTSTEYFNITVNFCVHPEAFILISQVISYTLELLCVRCYTTSKSIRTEDVKLSIFQTLWIQKWTTILHLIANINTAISRQYWLHPCLNKFTDLWMIFFPTETLCITRSAKSMLLKFTHSWPPWMQPISPYAQPMIYTAKTSWRPQLFLLASKLADLLTYSSRPIKPRQENRCK